MFLMNYKKMKIKIDIYKYTKKIKMKKLRGFKIKNKTFLNIFYIVLHLK